MAEVTSALTACGITICSCVVCESKYLILNSVKCLLSVSCAVLYAVTIQLFSGLFTDFCIHLIGILFVFLVSHHLCSCVFQAEVNKRGGMGVMLFHFEGSYENVVCLLN